VGPQTATAINPAAGALIGIVVNAVTQAEQAGGSGAAKKAAVIKSVLPVASGVVAATLQARGASANIDPNQLSTAIGGLVDGVVALMNAVQTPAAAGGGSQK
jgi:hypothetical protein